MKKILAIVSVAIVGATFSHGAAIDWQISGMNSELKNYLGTTAANVPVYLVLADSTSIATITDTASQAEFEEALANITIGSTTTGSDGKKPADWASTSYTKTFESDLLTSGTSYTFGMLYASQDADGNGNYRLLASTQSIMAYDVKDPTSAQTVSLSWSNMGKASWSSAYAAPVPEPSTAALALAGLALLLKRRKA